MLQTSTISCPYCGETFETTLDLSSGSQQYIEDCYVCCRPIIFNLEVSGENELAGIQVSAENE